MGDNLTPEQRRKNMQHIKSKDTSIEKKMRCALWNSGIRYRKNFTGLPGKPDIVITKYKIAIFCDSSFWHGREFESKKTIDTNTEYWNEKIHKNIKRDIEINKLLKTIGWTVIRFWDYEINKNIEECVQAVFEAIQQYKMSLNDFTM